MATVLSELVRRNTVALILGVQITAFVFELYRLHSLLVLWLDHSTDLHGLLSIWVLLGLELVEAGGVGLVCVIVVTDPEDERFHVLYFSSRVSSIGTHGTRSSVKTNLRVVLYSILEINLAESFTGKCD